MTNNYTEKELLELYNQVPEDIQEIILDKNLGPVIYVIVKEYGITALQSLEIEDIVSDVLLGITKPEDLEKNIASKLNIQASLAKKISEDIDENIFSAIKNSLAKINKKETTKNKIGNILETKKEVLINRKNESDIKKIAALDLSKKTPLAPQKPIQPIQNNNRAPEYQEHQFEEKLRNTSFPVEKNGEKPKIDPYREPLN